MVKATSTISAPKWFRLRTVVFSHGWFHLPPFDWNESDESLTSVIRVGGRPATICIQPAGRSKLRFQLELERPPSSADRREAVSLARRMLGLDVDMTEFYRHAGAEYGWAKGIGAGPFLRSASVFEDSVKMLATTNCSWSLTHQMVSRLVDRLGEPAPGGRKAFPTARQMAAKPVEYYRDVIRVGYRAPYFHGLSVAVASGRIVPEAWSNFQGDTDELIGSIRGCPGLGQYAAENLCKLLGRFDGLGIDSWCIKKFQSLHGPVRGDVVKAIERRYRAYGRWKGLALWLDLTRDWHVKGIVADESVVFQKK